MKIEAVIIYERSDLFVDFKNKEFSDISIYNIKHPREFFDNASLVLFIDNGGETKILKNRYGNKN